MSTGLRTRTRTTAHAWHGQTQIPTGRLTLHNTIGQDPGVFDDIDLGTYGVYELGSPYFSKIETCEDQLHAGPPYLEGGPFTSIKIESGLPSGTIGQGKFHSGTRELSIWGVGRGPYTYTGGFCNPIFPPYADGFTMTNQSQVAAQMRGLVPNAADTWGSDAWSKTKPHLEKAGLALAIREARDIPRMLSKSARVFSEGWKLIAGSKKQGVKMLPKKVGDHFLNHQFGWVPFVSDVEKMITIASNSREIIAKMTDENNRWIRRRRTLVTNSTSFLARKDLGWFMEPAGDTIGGLIGPGDAFRELWVQQEVVVTTAGSFRYYRPEFDLGDSSYWDKLNVMKRHLTIHGARINPSFLYNTTPWTWLIDWFSNAGDHVDMITDWGSDGLAAKYLYLMAHTKTTVKFKQFCPWKSGPARYECSRLIDIKQRVNANTPYGFSLSWGDLTARQLAILGALGLSRRS